MFYRRFMAAAIASVLTLTGLLVSAPAAAQSYLQCVPFARAESGVDIRGNAKTWWAQAASDYARGDEPRDDRALDRGQRVEGMHGGIVAEINRHPTC